MKRTTILADEALLVEIKRLGRELNKTSTAIIHEALADYVTRHRGRRKPISFVGIGHSGQADIAERSEEILANELRPGEGWSR